MASQVASCKYVPGTDFNVDGFKFVRPGTRYFFLTHFHGDHTVGLHKGFDRGAIYCSAITARLLTQEMGLRVSSVCPLTPHQPVIIDGVTVTPIPANHCPGSFMFLFAIPASDGRAASQVGLVRKSNFVHITRTILLPLSFFLSRSMCCTRATCGGAMTWRRGPHLQVSPSWMSSCSTRPIAPLGGTFLRKRMRSKRLPSLSWRKGRASMAGC